MLNERFGQIPTIYQVKIIHHQLHHVPHTLAYLTFHILHFSLFHSSHTVSINSTYWMNRTVASIVRWKTGKWQDRSPLVSGTVVMGSSQRYYAESTVESHSAGIRFHPPNICICICINDIPSILMCSITFTWTSTSNRDTRLPSFRSKASQINITDIVFTNSPHAFDPIDMLFVINSTEITKCCEHIIGDIRGVDCWVLNTAMYKDAGKAM